MKAWQQALAGCLLLFSLWASASAAETIIIQPAETTLTQQFIASLRAYQPGENFNVVTAGSPLPTDAQRVITLGRTSLAWLLEQKDSRPALATYLTHADLTSLSIQDQTSELSILLVSAQPLRQLRLSKLLIPRLSQIGMLYSPAQQWQLDSWREAARFLELELNSSQVNNPANLPRHLAEVLDRSDVLIGLDDPALFNAEQLKTILLGSYSRDRVLIGPSAAFVTPGSLATTYSTPDQMAQEVSRLLDQHQFPPGLHYPRTFSVLSNPQVARSLGLPIPDDQALAEQLASQEQQP